MSSRRLLFLDGLKFLHQAMSSVETAIQCQVCMELLHRPQLYVSSKAVLENELKLSSLSPCGHVFCPHCLREWFRKAPTAGLEPRNVLERPKFCPVCRARITDKPIPIFVLREVIDTLVKLKLQLLGVEPRSPATDIDGDPWGGIFPDEDEEEYI